MTEPRLIDTGLTVGFLQVVRAVWRRLWLVVFLAVAAAIFAFILLAPMPPVYTSGTFLWFDERESELLASDRPWSSLQNPNTVTYVNEVAPIVKEAEILQSLPILLRVIEDLELVDHPEVLEGRRSLAVMTIKYRIKQLLPDSWVAALESDPEELAEEFAETPIDPAAGVLPDQFADDPLAGYKVELARRLSGNISVSWNELTSMISVQVSSPDPEYAARIANLLPEALSEEHSERVTFASRSVVQLLSKRVEALRDRLEAEPLDVAPSSVTLQQIVRAADIDLFRSLLSRLNEVQQLQNIKSAPIHLIAPAVIPEEPAGSTPASAAIAAFVLVFLGGLGWVIVREIRSDLIRFPRQFETMGVEVLAAAPRLGRRMAAALKGGGGRPFGSKNPNSLIFQESIRRLLSLTRPGEGQKSVALLITSGAEAVGKSTIAHALATTAAKSNLRTILVEADIRPPRRSVAGPAEGRGLLGLLDNPMAELKDFIIEVNKGVGQPLSILPVVETTEYSTEVLASRAMQTIVKRLREQYDVVVIDSSPVGMTADAEVLASQMDGTILVVEYGRTTYQRTSSAIELLDRDSDNLLGVFVNKCDKRFLKDLYGAGEMTYLANAKPRPEPMRLKDNDKRPPSSTPKVVETRPARKSGSAVERVNVG